MRAGGIMIREMKKRLGLLAVIAMLGPLVLGNSADSGNCAGAVGLQGSEDSQFAEMCFAMSAENRTKAGCDMEALKAKLSTGSLTMYTFEKAMGGKSIVSAMSDVLSAMEGAASSGDPTTIVSSLDNVNSTEVSNAITLLKDNPDALDDGTSTTMALLSVALVAKEADTGGDGFDAGDNVDATQTQAIVDALSVLNSTDQTQLDANLYTEASGVKAWCEISTSCCNCKLHNPDEPGLTTNCGTVGSPSC
jgi:hypothetical protein